MNRYEECYESFFFFLFWDSRLANSTFVCLLIEIISKYKNFITFFQYFIYILSGIRLYFTISLKKPLLYGKYSSLRFIFSIFYFFATFKGIRWRHSKRVEFEPPIGDHFSLCFLFPPLLYGLRAFWCKRKVKHKNIASSRSSLRREAWIAKWLLIFCVNNCIRTF